MMKPARILILTIVATAISGCERPTAPKAQHVTGRGITLVEASESESGERELQFRLEAESPRTVLKLRFELPEPAKLEGVWHHRDATIVRFEGEDREYRFDYSDLLDRENGHLADGLLPLDRFQSKKGQTE